MSVPSKVNICTPDRLERFAAFYSNHYDVWRPSLAEGKRYVVIGGNDVHLDWWLTQDMIEGYRLGREKVKEGEFVVCDLAEGIPHAFVATAEAVRG